ncbi:ORF5a protein [Mikumi yellow baboon virus 1]|uniref:ORF5a protein n=1 Tax=Mikumi yellow baboon virus 1 TaxID=1546177 RepID=A0A089H3C8_9NIDO|nr:ORF5a protein [Mikumi yellow baboon virus 1]AIP91229.1 ORF5a protein [Mikumi yellow baboon virus 1]
MLQELGAFLDAFAINFIFVYLLVAAYVLTIRYGRQRNQSRPSDSLERHF